MRPKPHISHPKSKMALPLSHIRVLDLTRILSGPFCTMKLGDMGAEVIKIEQPGKGDDTRTWGPPFIKGESAYFLSVNRNKKSVTLDLKSNEGKKILWKLIKRSDVLVENFRAGVMGKLGFGYNVVCRINPRIVYCSISGYGQTSSRSNQPSYDLIVQGESGLMDVTGFPDGPPTKVGISLADVNAGNLAFEGILLALLKREKTGEGDYVDISLLDGLLSLFTYQSQIALSSHKLVTRKGNIHPTITPYEMYQTKDGFINVAVGNEMLWRNFCNAIGRPDLIDESRFRKNSLRVGNRAVLEKILVPIFRKRTDREWIKRLQATGVPVGSINPLNKTLHLPVVRERGMKVPMKHKTIGMLEAVGNPIKLISQKNSSFLPPPLLGQHTGEVLRSIGISPLRIKALREKGVV
jgi:crotonobetainyl-CoA:carnitine CoA-transferase CaiB-like acyl-CoA transferase